MVRRGKYFDFCLNIHINIQQQCMYIVEISYTNEVKSTLKLALIASLKVAKSLLHCMLHCTYNKYITTYYLFRTDSIGMTI